MTDLSTQQREAIEHIRRWHGDRDEFSTEPFRLFGPAGTGKTTLAREVPTALGVDPSQVFYAAYTGKAASVLRGKGCVPASTLHSLVYRPMANAETRAKLIQARMDQLANSDSIDKATAAGAPEAILDELRARTPEIEAEIQALEKESKTIGWEWNPDSPLAGVGEHGLLILDEVSMVDAKLAADIERFNVPILVLGDPEQLEPVGGEGYYIDARPDFALDEIHRQALDSPVLSLATRVRTSLGPTFDMTTADMEPRSLARAMEHDQILVWKNATRWSLIENIRRRLDRPPGRPVPGDRIMCLTNNKDIGIFNGQQFDVLDAQDGPLGPSLQLRDDTGAERSILSHAGGFQGRTQQDNAKSAYLGGKGQRGLFTFANAITVHKAQGSEWRTVYLVNEAPQLMDMETRKLGRVAGIQSARRWMYTGVTRASETITIGAPR